MNMTLNCKIIVARSDELLADWLAQDSGVKANEDFFAGELAATTP